MEEPPAPAPDDAPPHHFLQHSSWATWWFLFVLVWLVAGCAGAVHDAQHKSSPPWLKSKPASFWAALGKRAVLPIAALALISGINNFAAKIAYLNHRQSPQPNSRDAVIWDTGFAVIPPLGPEWNFLSEIGFGMVHFISAG